MERGGRGRGGEEMTGRHCWRCGKELPPGGLSYVVHLKVYADFDGVLVEPEEGTDQQLKEVLEEVRKSDPEKLEKEVYEEFTLLACKSCRDRFVDEVEHPWGRFLAAQGPDRILH